MTRRRRIVLFAALWLLYLAVGLYLALVAHFYFGDALSRVQSAQSVLFSRNPHLAAIGFIFTPLTVIVQLPLTALTPWIPEMTTAAVSAVIMSSVFMTAAVVQVAGIARDRGLNRTVSTLAVACFALNPMVVLYAANGMSEAPYLFFIALASRRLMRWVDTDDVHDLTVAGVALAFSYLTRYDGGAAVLAAGGLVAWVTYRRDRRAPALRRDRMWRTALDVVLVVSPAALAFVGWAFAGWLITGDAFAQFTSEYGNAAIIEQSGGSGSSGTAEALRFSMIELAILAPLLPLLTVVVIALRLRWRRVYPLLPALLMIGAVLAFQVISYMRGSTFGFLRFYMTVVLLAAVVAVMSVPARRHPPVRRPGPHAVTSPLRPRRRTRTRTVVAASTAVVVMAVSVPVTAYGMTSPKYAPQEFAVGSVVWPRPDSVSEKYLDERKIVRSFSTERDLARYLDRLGLPEGSVLVDTVYGFAVVVQSTHPKQFVIPSDSDFTAVLNDPVDHGVQFMLTVPRSGRGESDALNQRYPTLYENGAQISVLALIARNQGADLPDWRIYRVIGT
ncbi:glycosyltransferase family 39 protein [Gordonia desulfuricans]|uniref:Glycosyltransferase family 39 protein n=1 Tax=Gordonia desulfuricans TaxID=89051 RepID=A0A7K3LNX5_9ACTN|nr:MULTISPECIES: glycosyltransferase family 39 protein [Gordonia]NDK89942.1 glycosyltransferase family 39 protein [Gordonia desulfuricans]WLP92254.1 glycosyltransferase family 39 protein [Gordonia sp. NB41Y]